MTIRFEKHKKKSKTWLFPLIAIILLYITIPIVLINRGNVALENNFELLEYDSIIAPTKYYFAGIAFFETALVFPGFSTWATNMIAKSNKKMIDIYIIKNYNIKVDIYKELSKENITNTDSVIITIEDNIKKILIDKQKEEFIISDSLCLSYENIFCEKWNVFLKKVKFNTKNICKICK